MATPKTANELLEQLRAASYPAAKKDIDEIAAFAQAQVLPSSACCAAIATLLAAHACPHDEKVVVGTMSRTPLWMVKRNPPCPALCAVQPLPPFSGACA